MTTDYGCALGDATHQVNWLITHLNPPLTISVCDDDFPVAVIPLLASSLGVDQGRLYESVKRFTDREAAREARAAEATAAEASARDVLGDTWPDTADTAMASRLATLREQHGDLCPECGVAWDQSSPDCPHEINDVHPRPEAVAQ